MFGFEDRFKRMEKHRFEVKVGEKYLSLD